jgi:hypothetical protein
MMKNRKYPAAIKIEQYFGYFPLGDTNERPKFAGQYVDRLEHGEN